MIQQIISIEAAIKSGDKAQARRLLQQLLEHAPTADLWFLASQASETPEDEMKCIQKALALDGMHGKSRSRLFAIKQSQTMPPAEPLAPKIKPISVQKTAAPIVATEEAAQPLPKPALKVPPIEPLKVAKPQRRRSKSWRMVGCLGFLLLSVASSFFVMSVLGMGAAGWIIGLITGIQPVTEVDGVPIEDVAHAPLLIPANRSVPIESGQQQVDILYPGYAHEFTFNVRSGDELLVYVQFISPTAKSVSRNVAVVDPLGVNAEGTCTRGGLLTDNSGVAFTCTINRNGAWKVRIFGREGESSGAYFVSAETLR